VLACAVPSVLADVIEFYSDVSTSAVIAAYLNLGLPSYFQLRTQERRVSFAFYFFYSFELSVWPLLTTSARHRLSTALSSPPMHTLKYGSANTAFFFNQRIHHFIS
jgi:hypothetical protein